MRVPSVIRDPRGQNVSVGRDSGGGPLSPVVEGEGVSSVNDNGALGEANNVVNLPAGRGSGKDCIAIEELFTDVSGVGDGNEDVGGESCGGGSVGGRVGHQFVLKKNIIIIA